MCAKHIHEPIEKVKFLGETQSKYKMKNWSSLMLFNCEKCKNLSINYVNEASGLELHRFLWLEGDELIGGIDESWNFLIGVDNNDDYDLKNETKNPSLVHWTLGGPWFKEQRLLGGKIATKWFASRDDSIKLWD